MVERFTSKPIELPPLDRPFNRADLIFYGVDHSGSSFEAQVFFAPRGVGGEADENHRAYVGSFFIFGHGGCFGDIGHCDIPTERDPFDLRPPHQLEPATRVLTVTDSVRGLLERGDADAKVTVIARTATRTPADVLAFETVRLTTYA
jgi:tyrosinase